MSIYSLVDSLIDASLCLLAPLWLAADVTLSVIGDELSTVLTLVGRLSGFRRKNGGSGPVDESDARALTNGPI